MNDQPCGNEERISWSRAGIDNQTRDLIVSLLLLDIEPASISSDRIEFLSDLGATSIDALELIVAAEERFGIQFDDSQLGSELVRTLDGFIDAIAAKVETQASSVD